MNGESSFEYLTRNYETVYKEAKYERKIKLTDISKRNIMSRAMNKLNKLHDKKIKYNSRVNDLDEFITETRGRLASGAISTLEKEQLKYALKEAELERDKQVSLLPRKIQKVMKKIDKTVLKARRDLAKEEEKRPIKISDITLGRFKKLMARFEAIHHFFSADVSNITVMPNQEYEAAQINVENINSSEVKDDIDNAIAEEETKYQEIPEVSDATSMDSVVSDFVDSKLAVVDQEDIKEDEVVAEVTDIDVEQKLEPRIPITIEYKENEYFEIPGDIENEEERVSVQIPEEREVKNQDSKVMETSVEETSIDSEKEENSMQKYSSKLEELQKEFTVAASEGNVEKLREIKDSMKEVVNTINTIKESEENNLNMAMKNEDSAKKEEEEEKLKVINGLSSEIKSLMSDGNDGIERTNSLQQQTSATVARTEKIRASIDVLRSYSANMHKEQASKSELSAMLDDASQSMDMQSTVGHTK